MAEQPRTRYQPFPAIVRWPRVPIDRRRWEELVSRLARQRQDASERARSHVPQAALRAATLDPARAAADDPSDPATAATQASWRQAFASKGLPGVQALYEAELRAHELVAGAAAADTPLTEDLLLRVHEELVASHEQYPVRYGDDVVLEDVPPGQYKIYENFGVLSDGRLRSYCPPELVASEVARLAANAAADEFATAHPVLQSAYLLTAVDAIHPFADGNGRAARAIASMPLYRSVGLPLVVTPRSRGDYLAGLEQVPRDDGRAVVEFVFRRGVEAMTLAFDALATSALS